MGLTAELFQEAKSPTTDRRIQRFSHVSSTLLRNQGGGGGHPGSASIGTGQQPPSSNTVSQLPSLMPAPPQQPPQQIQDEELLQEIQKYIPTTQKELNWEICW